MYVHIPRQLPGLAYCALGSNVASFPGPTHLGPTHLAPTHLGPTHLALMFTLQEVESMRLD